MATANASVAALAVIHLEHDTFGDPSGQPLLLVMGLGFQLIHWDPEFCRRLADRGFYVIRFDNRDVGLSTKIHGGPKPNPLAAFAGFTDSASYTLWDMADDAAQLLDHLELPSAHVAGISMGGMIAQSLAIKHPDRVRSLASMLSTTGNRRVGVPRMRALGLLLKKAPSEREAYIDFAVGVQKVIGSRKYVDEDRVRAVAGAAFDRCHYPAGMMRQLVAIQASGDRTEQLKKLDVPTVVIHGSDDPLVPTRAGHATARAIPGSRMLEIPDLAHDLPPAVWDQVIDAIAENTERSPAAEARAAA
jgi:pimeloyl-ACP methyl ester carboxylesterase